MYYKFNTNGMVALASTVCCVRFCGQKRSRSWTVSHSRPLSSRSAGSDTGRCWGSMRTWPPCQNQATKSSVVPPQCSAAPPVCKRRAWPPERGPGRPGPRPRPSLQDKVVLLGRTRSSLPELRHTSVPPKVAGAFCQRSSWPSLSPNQRRKKGKKKSSNKLKRLFSIMKRDLKLWWIKVKGYFHSRTPRFPFRKTQPWRGWGGLGGGPEAATDWGAGRLRQASLHQLWWSKVNVQAEVSVVTPEGCHAWRPPAQIPRKTSEVTF